MSRARGLAPDSAIPMTTQIRELEDAAKAMLLRSCEKLYQRLALAQQERATPDNANV